MKRCLAPVFSASNALVCLLLFLIITAALAILELIYRITGSESIRCQVMQLRFRLANCGRGNSDPTIDLCFDLNAWLAKHPAIRAAIKWEAPTRDLKTYDQWTAEQKSRLASACSQVRRARSSGLPEVPPLDVYPPEGGTIWSTNLMPDLAWSYYLAYVAQSLMAEARGWFAWSSNEYSSDELASLFDSRYLFAYRNDLGKYIVTKMYSYADTGEIDCGATTPGDPGRTFAFLFDNGLIASTRRRTIENLMEWCRPRLVHFEGDNDPDNLVDYWQFGGFAPAERIIQGTVRSSSPELGRQHWTAGCWGTTAFLRLVLRTANIPVRNARLRCSTLASHSAPEFMSEHLYLSHGDDLYGKFNHATPPIPTSEYLVDQATFDAWFGDAVPDAQSCSNVGRRGRELALEYLPNGLLRAYCQDIAAGLTHANGAVYAVFARNFTVAELEATGLWGRMDAKIAAFGGCANIPETPGLYGG